MLKPYQQAHFNAITRNLEQADSQVFEAVRAWMEQQRKLGRTGPQIVDGDVVGSKPQTEISLKTEQSQVETRELPREERETRRLERPD
jgi:hypothetical protein